MSKALSNSFTTYTLSGQTLEGIRVSIPGLVRRYVQTETNASGVETYRTSKGKNTLFLQLCVFIKSMCQIDEKARLPDDIADAIRSAIKESVNERIGALMDEFVEHNVTVKTEQFGLKIKGEKWTPYKRATITMERHNLTDVQSKWAARCEIGKLSKQITKLEEKTELTREQRTKLGELQADHDTAQKAHKFYDEQIKLVTEPATPETSNQTSADQPSQG